MAQLILGRRERAQWREFKAAVRRRSEWLIGRLVIKDAVRLLIRERLSLAVCPADIEVIPDEHGRPCVEGAWAARLGSPLKVSLSHSGGVAAALVSDGGALGVGLDIEDSGRRTGFLEKAAFTDAERGLLETLAGSGGGDWMLRFWCAKEAASKAIGRGMNGNPRKFVIEQVDAGTGGMEVSLNGHGDHPSPATLRIPARTSRDGTLVVATALHEQT